MCDLQYESLAICHADALLKMWADADVIKYTNMTLPCTMEDVEKRIKIFQPLDVFAVTQDGELIGIIGCPPVNKEEHQFGLFYHFCKSSWGQGNATLATKWLIDYMRQKYKCLTLFADVAADNIASEKVLQKFGFQQISEEAIERDGKTLKVHNYRLLV